MDVISPVDLAAAATHLTPVLGRYFERSWSHGEGHRLFDTAGRAYLDFANGIAVTALGHHHPRVTAAIHAQADRLIGPTGAMGYAEPVVRLASMLSETLPDPIDSVMFLNSGSEAIDAALKLARRVTGRAGIIAFRGGFHGRTYGATSVTTSNINYRTGHEPLLPGIHIVPYPTVYPEFENGDAATAASLTAIGSLLRTVIPPSGVAAILIEPVLGEGGYHPAPVAFLRALRQLCDEHGILLIADEVQTGFGRTGRMWAFEHAEVVPDAVCVAKAIANGLPLSALVTRRELPERWGRGACGSPECGGPRAAGALGWWRARLDVRREPRRLRGGRRRSRDDPRRGPRGERGVPRPGAGGGPSRGHGRRAADRRRPRSRPDDRGGVRHRPSDRPTGRCNGRGRRSCR